MPNKPSQLSRNPFARETLFRKQAHLFDKGCNLPQVCRECTECGNFNGYGGLYQYGTQRDGINTQVNWHTGFFCSKKCHDIYHP